MSRGLIDSTLAYYQTHARESAGQYEQADSRRFLSSVLQYLNEGDAVLDVGCGTGRDAAFLLGMGLDAFGVDGSAAMIAEAERLHPELSGRLACLKLPCALPYPDQQFKAVISVAFLMHLPEADAAAVCREIHRVLVSGGKACISLRGPIDPGSEIDASGRFYSASDDTRWQGVFASAGFTTIGIEHDADSLGREHLWSRYLLLKD